MDKRLPSAFFLALLMLGQPVAASKSKLSSEDAAKAYLHGRLAMSDEDYGLAAQLFGQAGSYQQDPILLRRSLDVAMLSGDLKSAVKLANQIDLGPSSTQQSAIGDTIITLIRAGAAMNKRDWRAYDAARAAYSAPGRGGESGQLLTQVLDAWGKAGRGQIEEALALLDSSNGKGIGVSYLQEHRAHMLAYAKRWPEAAAAYAALVEGEASNVSRLRLAAAATLMESAPKDEAIQAKVREILAGGASRDSMLIDARARLAADPKITGRKLGDLVETPERGLSLAFVRLAADLVRERAVGAAVNFARVATLTDPKLPDAWLVASDVLARAERPVQALEALDQVPATAVWQPLVEIRRTNIYVASNRTDEARARLLARVNSPDANVEDYARLADLERKADRKAEAIAAYDKAFTLLKPPEGGVHGQLYFLRGSLREQAGDWAGAEADLRRAVAIAPKNAVYLNYLGYSLLDKGLKLQEGRDLVAQAYALQPENGAIIDSMGWAEYRMGNYAEAVRLLELAREAEPSDPTVFDHLGDALWQTGRRIEARHAWAAASALSPDDKLGEILKRKLDIGLDKVAPKS